MNLNSIYKKLINLNQSQKSSAIALIDPDVKNNNILERIINTINSSSFDVIFVGGSIIMDHLFEERLNFIKSNTDLPVILFPGSSTQISRNADALLFLSLISGRNPQYLIGEHVQSAPKIYNLGLETIATGYILIDSGYKSSVEIMSNTTSIPLDKKDIILAHALAGEYLGQKLIYLEMGSNSKKSIDPSLVRYVKDKITIPLIIGGGIKTRKSAELISKAGADFIVISSLIEESYNDLEIKDICNTIHGN